MKNSFLSLVLVIISLITPMVSLTAQSLPKYVLHREALEQNKKKVVAKQAGAADALQQLAKEADAALTEGPFSVMDKKSVPPSGDKHDYMSLAPYFWPDPSKADGVPYIRKDGEVNPEVKEYLDKEYIVKMTRLTYTLAVAYYFSNDERYAKRAALLIKTWFLNPATKMNPNLNFAQAVKGVNQGRGIGLIETRNFIEVINATGLIKGSKSWSAKDDKDLKKWFAEFLKWMQTSKNGLDEMKAKNNHGTFYDAQRLSFALYVDSLQQAKQIVESAANRLDQQMDESGRFPEEMARTLTLHYSVFNLEAFFIIAELSEATGFDFWSYTSPKRASLQKAFSYLKPYLLKQKEWEGKQITPFNFKEAGPLLKVAGKKLGCEECKTAVDANKEGWESALLY